MPDLVPAPKQPLVAARFNPLIRPYLVLQVGAALAVSLIGLPLAVLWFLGVGQWWARHYFDKLECHLDDRKLRFKRGILVTVDKTIPLENIQDVTFVEGPILRHFNLATLKFETGGSGAGQAHDMQLTGLIDAHLLRDEILARRDALKQAQRQGPAQPESGDGEQLAVLLRIEGHLAALVEALGQRKV
jgi:putative membrane protein